MREHILQVVKATLAAIIFSLACVLAFSLFVQLFSLSSAVIKPVNQVLKTLCIAAGGILFIRGSGGIVKGAVYGAVAVLATYVLFSAMSGDFSVTGFFALEVLIGAVSGAVSGVIGVNIKGRN